jgi:acyl-CoA thioesterase FadM
MPRVKLREQSVYEFHYQVILQVRDINYGGHLGNDALVGLLHEARLNLLRELGCTESNLGDGKTGVIMADLVVNYLAEGFMFDCLSIDSHLDEISRSSFRLFHRLAKDGQLLALAETGMVAFDYINRKVTSIPKVFLQSLAQISG